MKRSLSLLIGLTFTISLFAQSFFGKDAFGGKHNVTLNFALNGTPEVGIAYTHRSGLFAGYNHDGFLGNPWDVQIGMNCDVGRGFQNGPTEFYAGLNALIGGGEEVYSTAPGMGFMAYLCVFRTPQANQAPAIDVGVYGAVLPGIYHDTYEFAAKIEAQKILLQGSKEENIPSPQALLPLDLGHDNPSPSTYAGVSVLAQFSGKLDAEWNKRSLYGFEIGGYRHTFNQSTDGVSSSQGSLQLDARVHLGMGR
ncbi:MAG: hypothetical protein AAF587_26125 [Bacteroidota bacterium]